MDSERGGVQVNDGTNPEEKMTGREAAFSARVLEGVGCLLMVLEAGGRIVRFNAACEALTGVAAAEACGKLLWELPIVPAEQAADIRAFCEKEWQTGDPMAMPPLGLLAPDKRVRHIAWKATVMNEAGGTAGHLVLSGMDLTELHAAKLASEKAQQSAEAASRAKSAFVASMSHELRTPMTAILGHIDLLEEEGECGGELSLHERRKSLRTIRRNAEHLVDLVNDVLDLSKIEAGKLETERIACSPLQIISEVAAVMRLRAVEKRIAFQVKYIGPIPKTITTDPTRLRQVLMNLVGNALKFTHSGSVRLLVRLLNSNSLDKPQLQFQVVDTGIGMTQEQIASLFRPFTQAEATTTRRFGGTGLGLSISKRLAEAMGGGIVVDSISGAGTTFTATIDPGPLQGVELIVDPAEGDTAFAQHAALIREAPTEPLLAGTRILIAEDGPDNQYLIALLLRRAGAKITGADNGRYAVGLALDAAREGQAFDLILMDMQMPEMDGYAATRRLRERGYRGKIMALTAHTMPGDRERCLAEGCDAYMPKPFEPERLVARACELLGRPVTAGDVVDESPEEPWASLVQALEQALRAEDLPALGNSAMAVKSNATEGSALAQSAVLVERATRAGLGVGHLSRAVEDLIHLCKMGNMKENPAADAGGERATRSSNSSQAAAR
ncbi:MAG: ATP-binding protein [Phycisphaerae bacterium]